MTEPTLLALTARIDRLERKHRRLRAASLLVLLGAAAAVLMGQTAPRHPARSVEAEEFVLRDSRGQVRASLGTTQNPSTAILQIQHESGKPRARLLVSSDGTASLEFMDSGDRVRLLLGLREGGAPRLWLGNEAGKIIWRAP